MEHPDRIRVIDLCAPHSLFEELALVMQKPFPVLTYLRLQSQNDKTNWTSWTLPHTFLAGSAPRLQKICLDGISFPTAPSLLLSAHDLVDLHLCEIPLHGYIPPGEMVASLVALPKLKYFTLEFEWGTPSLHNLILLPVPPITRTVLPALTKFHFKGLPEYFEDLVAHIDTPQLDCLQIEYQDELDESNLQIPQLCKFIDRSEKLKLSWDSRHAQLLFVDSTTVAIRLFPRGRSSFDDLLSFDDPSSFGLTTQDDVIDRMTSQLRVSAMLSNVEHLSIIIQDRETAIRLLGRHVRWLELFRPFTAVKALFVTEFLSSHVRLALKNVAEESAASALPALVLLCLEGKPVPSLEAFLAARQNVGRPVTVIDEEREFRERVKTLDVGE